MYMHAKLIAHREFGYPDIMNGHVLLNDHQGSAIRGRIVPMRSVPRDIIEAIPEDGYVFDYKGTLRTIKGFSGSSEGTDHYADAMELLSDNNAVYYAVVDAQAPTVIYGYAGFQKNDKVGCLELRHIYSRNHFTDSAEMMISNFGRSVLQYGLFLQELLFPSHTPKVLYVSRIRAEAKKFYKAMGFRHIGFAPCSSWVLRRKDADEVFGPQ